jgi:hypothetical protein
MLKKIILTICLIIGGLFCASSVFAMTISPPVQEFTADPGTIEKGVIKLFNDENNTRTLYADIRPFTARGEKGEPGFSDEKIDDYMLASWIHLERTEIILEPGQRIEIPYIISVPSYAESGGHYAAIFWSTQAPDVKSAGAGVAIASKIGSLVLLRVQGEIIEQGRLSEFSLKEKKKFYNHLPIDFIVRFENTGNVHLKPFGKIEISDMFYPVRNLFSDGVGKKIDGVLVNTAISPEGSEVPIGNVLPQSKRMFEVSWAKNNLATPPKTFLEKVRYEKENFALGKYEGILNLEYGSQQQKIQRGIVFWVFPWRLILVCLTGFVFLILLIVFGIKRYNRWIVGKSGFPPTRE